MSIFQEDPVQPITAVDATGTGTITGNGQTVVATCDGSSSISWTPFGIYVATFVFEASLDGTTWVTGIDQGLANGIGLIQIPCGGYKQMRLRCTGYTSGTINVTWYSGLGIDLFVPYQRSGTTLAISAATLPLPSGGATAALQTTGNASLVAIDAALPVTLGQTVMANSLAVTIASDQSALNVNVNGGIAGTLANGTETAVAGTAVQVIAANSGRDKLIIQNTGLANVRVGTTGVTITTGMRLTPGSMIIFDSPNCPTNAIFAIREGTVSSIVMAQEIS